MRLKEVLIVGIRISSPKNRIVELHVPYKRLCQYPAAPTVPPSGQRRRLGRTHPCSDMTPSFSSAPLRCKYSEPTSALRAQCRAPSHGQYNIVSNLLLQQAISSFHVGTEVFGDPKSSVESTFLLRKLDSRPCPGLQCTHVWNPGVDFHPLFQIWSRRASVPPSIVAAYTSMLTATVP